MTFKLNRLNYFKAICGVFIKMLKIDIPNNFIPERSYVLNIFFNEFLGIDYQLNIASNRDYSIMLENGHKLIFEDHFFSEVDESAGYLNEKNIPNMVKLVKNNFTIENDLVCIYGNEELIVDTSSIRVGVDIFASAFFMLTRWEEYVNKERDLHNRFSASTSLAYKNNFLYRPIVNEYLELLWNILIYLGYDKPRKKMEFQLIVTHDVDSVYLWKNWRHVLYVSCADIIKRRNLILAGSRINEYRQIIAGKKKDPFDTFNWLMDLSEQNNIKSHFYFMSGGTPEYECNYDIFNSKVLKLATDIIKRGHIVGFHPSYYSYNDYKKWKMEKKKLEEAIGQTVVEGRQHYLRMAIPYTWSIWDDNNMKIDSTCGYADHEGFRCGTGNEFRVFDCLTRKMLLVRERPLLYMDDNRLYGERITNTDECINRIIDIIGKSKKYKMSCTILFHNSVFDIRDPDYKEIYCGVFKASL